MSDYLLSLFQQHGLPVLFLVLLVGSLAVPFPTNVLVIAAGSFVEQGEMSLIPLLAVLMVGSLIGDSLGFALGRLGGKRLAGRIAVKLGGEETMLKGEQSLRKWGAACVFFTRWLVASPGPFVNLICGFTGYSFARFILWSFLGQSIWVALYVCLGYFFSDRVQILGELVRDIAGTLIGVVCVIALSWWLWRSRESDETPSP